jgi:hypothetical protein
MDETNSKRIGGVESDHWGWVVTTVEALISSKRGVIDGRGVNGVAGYHVIGGLLSSADLVNRATRAGVSPGDWGKFRMFATMVSAGRDLYPDRYDEIVNDVKFRELRCIYSS